MLAVRRGDLLLPIFAIAAFLVAPAVIAQAPPHTDDGSEYEPPPAPTVAPSPSASGSAHPIVRADLPVKDGMVRLPGARFTMGTAEKGSAANEKPPRAVTVAPFWLDKTEITVSAYRACVGTRACAAPARKSPGCTYELNEPELPVTCVHWKDADAFCRAAGKRLPRESEWEYAARGTSNVRYPWGGAVSNCVAAVTLQHEQTARSCSGRLPAKVGTHPAGASVFGVLDLTGNVEEWTSDWYVENPAEGSAPRAGASHVLRGGGWLSNPSMSRVTSRNWGSALEAGPNIGFRCAKDAAPAAPAPPRGN